MQSSRSLEVNNRQHAGGGNTTNEIVGDYGPEDICLL